MDIYKLQASAFLENLVKKNVTRSIQNFLSMYREES